MKVSVDSDLHQGQGSRGGEVTSGQIRDIFQIREPTDLLIDQMWSVKERKEGCSTSN